jgi:hypothetical protein
MYYYIKFSFLFFSLCLSRYVAAQKKHIDTAAIQNWSTVDGYSISNNGKFVMFSMANLPVGSETIVLKSMDNAWQQKFPDAKFYSAQFSADSRWAAFLLKTEDTICVTELGRESVFIGNVRDFSLLDDKTDQWLAYRINSDTSINRLVLHNLNDKTSTAFDAVLSYRFFKPGNKVLIHKMANDTLHELLLFDLAKRSIRKIATAYSIDCVILNDGYLAFMQKEGITFCNVGKKNGMYAKNIILNNIPDEYTLSRIDKINANAAHIHLKFSQKKSKKDELYNVSLDVWSYTDSKLQSEQLSDPDPKREFEAIFDMKTCSLVVMESIGEKIIYSNKLLSIISASNENAGAGEYHWNPLSGIKYFTVNNVSGIREEIPILKNRHFEISPNGKYAVYFDSETNDYYSYNFINKETLNLTKQKVGDWSNYVLDSSGYRLQCRGIAGWNGDSVVIVYDRYDVWQLSMSGANMRNLTGGYGRQKNLVFFVMESDNLKRKFIAKDDVILIAYNYKTKQNGFYKGYLKSGRDPKLLSLGNCYYQIPDNPYLPDGANIAPVKARDVERYVVRRMDVSHSPNLFLTNDFINFIPLTDFRPESEYVWMKSELLEWASLNGDTLQGILYKPDNFDSTKKYPVIIYFYEKQSDRLNVYLKPETSGGGINIPYFVSNGYLIFTPDIHYKKGDPGTSAYESVVSGVKYLSRLPFVDSSKIGLQGVSWASYQINFIVTHTDIFAAACSAVGPSDLVSFFGSLSEVYSGLSMSAWTEIGQGRMTTTPWQDPQAFVKNSPIFFVDKVRTPILLAYNKGDGVNFLQGVEFFTALRRAGKIAWMLQYDDGGHAITGKAGIDFTIRLEQFFDHYLKGKGAPVWMTRGVAAKDKGFVSGLEIDSEIETPPVGGLLKKAN